MDDNEMITVTIRRADFIAATVACSYATRELRDHDDLRAKYQRAYDAMIVAEVRRTTNRE